MTEITPRRPFADLRPLVFTLALILVGAIVMFLISPPPQKSTLSSRSDERDGALALRWWLERSGYTVAEAVTLPADLDSVDVLFVLEPDTLYTPEVASAVRNWVRAGNTLIAAGRPFALSNLLAPFDVEMLFSTSVPERLTPDTLLNQPPVESVYAPFPYGILSERDDLTTYFAHDGVPVLVSFSEGRGTVWVSGMLDPFTNLGIQDEQHARLILNFLASATEEAHIAFDEGLYVFGDDTQTVGGWLTGTPPGWGILGAVAITVMWLFAHGRRFGRPLPLPEEKLRREPVEYIRAVARLFRRAGGRDDVMRHYKAQFRRRLARRYGVDPSLNDAEFVRHLVYSDPSLDEAALRDMLSRLSRGGISESDLLETANDVDNWLRKLT